MTSKQVQRQNITNWQRSIFSYESKQHKRKVKKLAEIERKLDGTIAIEWNTSLYQQALKRAAQRTTAKMIKLLNQEEWKLRRQLKRGY